MNELDQAVEVLGGNGLVLLVEIVDVSVEDFHKEFNGDRSVHAGVGHAKSALKTFENSFAIAVKLGVASAKDMGTVEKVETYIFGVFLSALRVLDYPPEMTSEIHCAALVRLLEELASMQRSFGNKRIIVLLGESTTPMQGTRNDANSLELSARVTDCILVDGKCLREELVADFFESCLICDLTTHHKQSQRKIGAAWIYALIQTVDALMHKPVESRRL